MNTIDVAFKPYLERLCIVKNNIIYFDYSIFKTIANDMTYDMITNYITSTFSDVLKKKEQLTIHLSLKLLTINEADKHYNYISRLCSILKTDFPDKLLVCYVYNAPFIFFQIFSIISIFVDKPTQDKIQIMDKTAIFGIL
jgi:hypothetical protein